MNNERLFQIICVMCAVAVTLSIYGCAQKAGVEDQFDLADSLMETRPDSVLSILDEMDHSELGSHKNKARYALLKSMALDKNFVDTATFDVLQPAIDYYLKGGNVDQKLRTRYYQGRIYENAGEDDLAMQSYLQGLDYISQVSDSLTVARMLIAQGGLYYKQYLINNLVVNNLKAADIYGGLGKKLQQLKCNLRALYGAIILNNKQKADSILNICKVVVKDSVPLETYALQSFLLYDLYFSNDEEMRARIKDVQRIGITDDMKMNLARAYCKIGNPETGLRYLNEAKIPSDNILDSLTYWSVKTEILENLGEDRQALDAFRNYSRVLEVYHDQLFSNELLFAEKKHEMEIENMAKLRKRDNAIKWILVGVIVLIIVTALIYYRYRMNKAGRLLAERNAEKIQLEGDRQRLLAEKLAMEGEQLRLREEILTQERDRLQSETVKLQKESESLREDSASIERDRATLREKAERLQADGERLRQESEQLEKDRDSYRLKSEQLQSEMDGLRSEAENLHHQIQKLEEEQEELKRLVERQDTLSDEARGLIRERIEMLNGLFAQAITKEEKYGRDFQKYAETIRKDKKNKEKFQDSLVKVLETTHPEFMAYLQKHGLTEREVRYSCLYAIGLRGKEIGTYLGVAGHYNISADVRRKLGMTSNAENLGPYLRKLMDDQAHAKATKEQRAQ